jgi:hypothetical protein
MVAPPGGVKSDRKIGVDQSLGRRLPETAPFALSRSAAFFLLSFVTLRREVIPGLELIFSRSRSVTSRRNNEFSCWS